MRIVRTMVLVLVALTLVGATTASAQDPYIGIFFERNPTPDGITEASQCQGVGVIDTVYAFLYNAQLRVCAVEFKVFYPAIGMTWILDLPDQPVNFGNTRDGFSMGWAFPGVLGPRGIFIAKVLIQWNCALGCPLSDVPITVGPHPFGFGFAPVFIDCQTNQPHEAVGLTALVCATVPVEETTWGRVKELYDE